MDKDKENPEKDVTRSAEIVNMYAAGVALVIPASAPKSEKSSSFVFFVKLAAGIF